MTQLEGRPRRRAGSLRGPVLLVTGSALIAALIVSLGLMIRAGGEAARQGAEAGIASFEGALDAEAKLSLQRAQMTAMQLEAAGAEVGPGFLVADAAGLSQAEPSLSYTEGASTGPTVVSVAATEAEWAAAVLSESGTCWWIHIPDGVAANGSGSGCTGVAAMSA